jgi:hypothetical protein
MSRVAVLRSRIKYAPVNHWRKEMKLKILKKLGVRSEL